MKILFPFSLFILLLLQACDPYNFGYKHNPAWTLDVAFKAVRNQDTESFLEVSGKEALCLYGNEQGIDYLKENVSIDLDDVKLRHKLLEARHHKIPEFVGYWSYYFERHKVDVVEEKTNAVLIEAVVDCNFGTLFEKDEELEGLKPYYYQKKACKLVKIIPKSFRPKKFVAKCEALKVDV